MTHPIVNPSFWEDESAFSLRLVLSAALERENAFSCPVAASACTALLYLRSGTGWLETEGCRQELASPLAVLLPGWQAWMLTAQSELSLTLIVFTHPQQELLAPDRPEGQPLVYPVSELPKDLSALTRLTKSGAQLKQPQAIHLLCTMLKSLLSDGGLDSEVPKPIPPQILRMKELMDTQFGTSLSLDVLAQQLGQSKFHLSRTFLACYHMTPGAYLTRVRMEQAARLLRTSDLPVKEIGCQVGYPNDTYFVALFKKHYELTPKQYRTEQRFQE